MVLVDENILIYTSILFIYNCLINYLPSIYFITNGRKLSTVSAVTYFDHETLLTQGQKYYNISNVFGKNYIKQMCLLADTEC